jgi:hypothetical protein
MWVNFSAEGWTLRQTNQFKCFSALFRLHNSTQENQQKNSKLITRTFVARKIKRKHTASRIERREVRSKKTYVLEKYLASIFRVEQWAVEKTRVEVFRKHS